VFHPLAPDLTGLKDDELYQKISELQKRMNQAWRMGGTQMFQQMQLLMGDYQGELRRRNDIKLEEMQKKNPGFDKIIDIK
jgi:hypothetical protein